jgi:hypothetical protein
MSAKLKASNLVAMHFVRPVGEAKGSRVHVGVGKAEVRRHSSAAMGLDRSVPDLVHAVGGVQHQKSRLIDQDARFGDALERHRAFADGLAECRPARHIFSRARSARPTSLMQWCLLSGKNKFQRPA